MYNHIFSQLLQYFYCDAGGSGSPQRNHCVIVVRTKPCDHTSFLVNICVEVKFSISSISSSCICYSTAKGGTASSTNNVAQVHSAFSWEVETSDFSIKGNQEERGLHLIWSMALCVNSSSWCWKRVDLFNKMIYISRTHWPWPRILGHLWPIWCSDVHLAPPHCFDSSKVHFHEFDPVSVSCITLWEV